jgi:hypothetical protein
MTEKTKEITEKAGIELGLRLKAKAEEFRERENGDTLTIESIEDMWGCLKKEAHEIIEEFYNGLTNSIDESEIVKKKQPNYKRMR